MDAVQGPYRPPPALTPLSLTWPALRTDAPRRFSVSLTFSVLCLSMVLSSSRPMMAAIALACFMAQETQRAALSIIYGASLRDDEILRSFSLSLFSPPRFFFFHFTPTGDVRRFALFAGFAESRALSERAPGFATTWPSLSVRDTLSGEQVVRKKLG